MNRRQLLQLAAASAVSAAGVGRLSAEKTTAAALRKTLPRGYLLAQEVCSYNISRFGAISTKAEAEALFAKLAERLNAVEFGTLYYGEHDLRAHEIVAHEAVRRGVDLWTSSFTLLGKIHAFGTVRPEFFAYAMEPDGHIVPAVTKATKDTPSHPVFDVLNPEGVEWFFDAYRRRYLERMKGLLAGFFLNEDCLTYLGAPANNRRYDYWRVPTYSPRVLKLWQAYCRRRNIMHENRLVDKFPVHDPAMVANGGGQTAYFPGWNVPATMSPDQRFVDMPRAEGVWRAWYDFLCETMLDNWIGRLAAMAQEVNRSESIWKGVMYFGLHHWSLPYEQIRDREFTVPKMHAWGAWGRQRGVDLERLAAHPAVDVVVCETYPPVAANLEGFVAEFARITREAKKTYGVMLHRDDGWPLKGEEESRRWTLIEKYRPTVITRYPLRRMFAGDQFYNAQAEAAFVKRLEAYRKG